VPKQFLRNPDELLIEAVLFTLVLIVRQYAELRYHRIVLHLSGKFSEDLSSLWHKGHWATSLIDLDFR